MLGWDWRTGFDSLLRELKLSYFERSTSLSLPLISIHNQPSSPFIIHLLPSALLSGTCAAQAHSCENTDTPGEVIHTGGTPTKYHCLGICYCHWQRADTGTEGHLSWHSTAVHMFRCSHKALKTCLMFGFKLSSSTWQRTEQLLQTEELTSQRVLKTSMLSTSHFQIKLLVN